MPKRERVASKIPTTKTNTNKKKPIEIDSNDPKVESSLFKKNEFALILFGALLLTLILFFLFFRNTSTTGTDEKTSASVSKQIAKEGGVSDLEARIQQLEALIKNTDETNTASDQSKMKDPLEDRVARLETAFGVKFDSIIDRMDNIEQKLRQINLKQAAQAKAAKTAATAVKKKTAPVKKAPAESAKAPMFHTIKKGETLYSIGRKYKISPKTLRKLNNLAEGATLYPGMNLLIR